MIQVFVLDLIKLYQRTTWFFPKVCRFYPSCSNYMMEAIQMYGVWQGIWMGSLRLCRCHPLHPGGIDPVSKTQAGSEAKDTACNPTR